tara:strand:- start:1077 stop:1256 length:180 start_codon:yes stop_codon:yes gene_type:complete
VGTSPGYVYGGINLIQSVTAMNPDTQVWPVVLVAATVVIIFMALAASSTGTFECVGACG